MTSEEQNKTWKFFAELAAFDGSTDQIDDWGNRYSRNDMSGGFGIVRDNKKEFLERFSKDEMVNIVKATTLLEEKDRGAFNFGSVHPAILIIKLFRETHPEECDELDTWVIENSTNSYLPWGTMRGLKKSFADLQETRAMQRANAAAEEERQVPESGRD